MDLYLYKARLERIVDGDSLRASLDLGMGVWLSNQNIRLYNLDTPESRTSCKIEKRFGLLAKDFLAEHVKDDFILRTHKDKGGKYGRTLAEPICYIPLFDREMSVCDAMVQLGLGVAYTGQSKASIADQHLANRERLLSEGKISL